MRNRIITLIFIIVTTFSCSNESEDYYIKTYYLTRYYFFPRKIKNTVFNEYYNYQDNQGGFAPFNDTIIERMDTICFNSNTRDTSLNGIIDNIDIYLKKYYSVAGNKFYPITSNICLYRYKSDTLAATEPFFREIPFEFDLFLITYFEPNTQIVDTIDFSYFVYANKRYNCLCLSNKDVGINKFLRKIDHIRNDSIVSHYDLGSIPYQCAIKCSPFLSFDEMIEKDKIRLRMGRINQTK